MGFPGTSVWSPVQHFFQCGLPQPRVLDFLHGKRTVCHATTMAPCKNNSTDLGNVITSTATLGNKADSLESLLISMGAGTLQP